MLIFIGTRETRNKSKRPKERFKPTDLLFETEAIVGCIEKTLDPFQSIELDVDLGADDKLNIKELQSLDRDDDGWEMNIIIFKVSKLKIKDGLKFVIPQSLGKIFEGKSPEDWLLMKDNDNMEYVLSRIAGPTKGRSNVSREGTNRERVFMVKDFFFSDGGRVFSIL